MSSCVDVAFVMLLVSAISLSSVIVGGGVGGGGLIDARNAGHVSL